MTKILVLGQIPPPLGGQAVMMQALIDAEFKDIRWVFVPMRFSQDFGGIGKPSLYKVTHMFTVLGNVYKAFFREKPKILYYAPGGAKMAPVLRDVFILFFTRFLFKKTIFHFHAGDLESKYNRMGGLAKLLFRKSLFRPDLAIHVSDRAPDDGGFLKAGKTITVPNGIPEPPLPPSFERTLSWPAKLLFVGMLSEDKGLMVCLEALKELRGEGLDCRFKFMGSFSDGEIRDAATTYIEANGLSDSVQFLGSLSGMEKWNEFKEADVFVFPSFFAAETFGIVVVEAMSVGTPVVATNWRGIPSIVKDGETGLLTPIKDPTSVAKAVKRYLNDADLRHEVSIKGRKLYEENYSLEIWKARMEKAFHDVIGEGV